MKKIIQDQEKYILNATKWLSAAPFRYETFGDIGHNLFIIKRDYEDIKKLLLNNHYLESYCEVSESGTFEGYSMWLTNYKNILLTESEIIKSITEILTILKPYDFMYVDSFFLMTEKGEYFNGFCD